MPKSTQSTKSTTRQSYEQVLGGLAFAPTKEQREHFSKKGIQVFIGLTAFYEAKTKDPSVVYDYAGALVDQGIPILDAVYRDGIYHRSPMSSVETIKVRSQVIEGGPLQGFKSKDLRVLHDKGVRMVSEEAYEKSTGHGKMSRGAGHRVKKK